MISLSLLLSSHLRIFQHPRVRSFTVCYYSFNLLKSRSPPLRVYCQRLGRAIRTRFPFASSSKNLRLATDNNSQTHYAKGKQSRLAALRHIVCNGCRFYFTPLTGVLFTFPSRYLFTIGCQGVFSLIQWSGQIHAEFHVHRITWDTSRRLQTSRTRLSRSMAQLSRSLRSSSTSHIKVPQPREDKSSRFRLFRFRSPLLTESLRFLFLGLLRCFTSPRFASPDYEFIRSITGRLNPVGLSHSEIHGSKPACGSPWLIATCYVLHRLLAPRHSPYALSSLITKLTYQSLPGSTETQRIVICPILLLTYV